jgi:hypothetical protein
MLSTEIQNSLREALSIEDSSKRGWAYAKAVVKIGGVEELEEAWAFIQSFPELSERARQLSMKDQDDDILYAIENQRKWIPQLEFVDSALKDYPRVAERVTGVNYKVALLHFADFCNCDVGLVCKVLEEIIKEFESGKDKVVFTKPQRHPFILPRNYRPLVEAAIAHYTQYPCWVLKHLFLPERGRSGAQIGHGGDFVFFERKKVEAD